MLERLKEFINKRLRLNPSRSSDLFENLKVWNKDLQQYMNVVNPKYSFWEIHKKIKELPLDDLDSNREFVKLLCKNDPKTGKPYYETIINQSYKQYENSLKTIDEEEKEDAGILLNDIKNDSLRIFKSISSELEKKPNIKISSFRMTTLIKILRWDSICFVTNPWCDKATYIQFDKEYTSEWISRRINDYEGNTEATEKDKHLLIARRHVYEWADLSKMEECLKKYRDFSQYFIKWSKPYVASETRLNDVNFFKFYEEYLKKIWKDPLKQKIIQNHNLTKKYSICDIKLLPLNKEWVDYDDRKRKFIKEWESSLSKALQEYESLWFKLQEWKAVIDLTKID